MRLDDHIKRGHTVVCANARLAHHFRHLYAREQLRRGRRAWEAPDILPYRAWLRRCWNVCLERNGGAGLLLGGEQESALWQQVVEDSRYRDNLLQVSSVAEQAAGAWQRLKQYQVPVFPEDVYLNEDVYAFKSWADEYRLRCRNNNWIDGASLADALRLHAAAGPDAFGAALMLVGFDRLTPQQEALFRELESAGVGVSRRREEPRNVSAQVADFADAEEEIRAAANWARRRLEANGEAAIGIITPDLRKLRARIRYIFEDMLAPGNLGYRDAGAGAPFTISLGQALADYPLIHVIFPLIGPGQASLDLETLGILLRTPFINGFERERAGRALLDEKLRSRNQLAFRWDEALYLADAANATGPAIPVMAAMLRELRSALEELPARQSPEAWAASFTRFLEIAGWPGERSPDSAEYQQVQAWHAVLDSLVSLRLVRPLMSRPEALSQVRRIAARLSFQPQSAETPIQALDPHGAAAMDFDHVWFLGLSEEAWPPRPAPNPFIPAALQKKYGIPGADADSALQQARLLQETLLRSTPEIILSHARNEADRPLLASPLLRDLPALADSPAPGPDKGHGEKTGLADAPAQAPEITPYSRVIFDSGTMETFTDTAAPPVAGRHSGGGANLFRDQSQCPFRAFARHRLHSRELAGADIGLDAMQRGSLLHRLMQNTWSQLRSQERLKAMSAGQREELVHSQVRAALDEYRRRYPLAFTERFSALEAKRLAQVLRDWLELELQRAPFTVVDVEAGARLAVGGVEFSARLDRVDALEDGRRVVIDYKSGQAGVNAWAGERPAEPQMPLYAATHPEPVAAVAFAGLKRGGSFGFAGLAEADGILPGTGAFAQDRRAKRFASEPQPGRDTAPPSWEELFDNWRAVLENLADEFRRGVATVTPSRGACDWCEQQPLCRIHEVESNPP